jgi:hypothetical protein
VTQSRVFIGNGMRCGKCNRELADGEPIYRVLTHLDRAHRERVSVCSKCMVPEFAATAAKHPLSVRWYEEWQAPEPCVNCHRRVYVNRFRKGQQYLICGEECRRAHYQTQARARIKALRRSIPQRSCAICGERFTPNRSDALYCSHACKQRAYRRRP